MNIKNTVIVLLIGWAVFNLVVLYNRLHSKDKDIKTVIKTTDTVYIRDTIYISNSFMFTAKKCDSLLLSSTSNLTASRILAYSPISSNYNPRFGIGVGVGYSLKDKNAYYYILGEYILRDYFSLGGYISPSSRAVGIYGKVRF